MVSVGFAVATWRNSIETILREADGHDYRMQAWVIMPNHVHLVVDVWNVPLVKLIDHWKGNRRD